MDTEEMSVLCCNSHTPTLVQTMVSLDGARDENDGCFPAKNLQYAQGRILFDSLNVAITWPCRVIRIIVKWNWYSEITDYLDIWETLSIRLNSYINNLFRQRCPLSLLRILLTTLLLSLVYKNLCSIHILVHLFTADKLSMDVGNTVTLFLDPKLDNSFMKSLHHDLQSVYGSKILTTSQQVNSNLFNLDIESFCNQFLISIMQSY